MTKSITVDGEEFPSDEVRATAELNETLGKLYQRIEENGHSEGVTLDELREHDQLVMKALARVNYDVWFMWEGLRQDGHFRVSRSS